MLVPIELERAPTLHLPAAIVLLDRDGVINRRDPDGYVTSPTDFHFLPGALDALRRGSRAGLSFRVVSNQSCVGRGLVPLEDVVLVMESMRRDVERTGGRIDRIHFCPHAPGEGCSCRKPASGMVEAALAGENGSAPVFLVGDRRSDIDAGRAVGAYTLLVDPDLDPIEEDVQADRIVRDLSEAIAEIHKRLVIDIPVPQVSGRERV
jgi:histidinol-phosphate phosphatase family protein